jgi:hypothetical protein
VEEVAGEHGGRLGGQEPSPGGVAAAHGRRWDAESFEDPADRGRADPVAEAQQFALNASVAQPGLARAICSTRATTAGRSVGVRAGWGRSSAGRPADDANA